MHSLLSIQQSEEALLCNTPNWSPSSPSCPFQPILNQQLEWPFWNASPLTSWSASGPFMASRCCQGKVYIRLPPCFHCIRLPPSPHRLASAPPPYVVSAWVTRILPPLHLHMLLPYLMLNTFTMWPKHPSSRKPHQRHSARESLYPDPRWVPARLSK